MPRRPSRFTQSDVARAIRAAQQVGEPMAVEIAPDGTIRLIPAPAPSPRKPRGDGTHIVF